VLGTSGLVPVVDRGGGGDTEVDNYRIGRVVRRSDMTGDSDDSRIPPSDLCAHWGLTEPRLLGHRANTHWRATSPRGDVVLRRYGPEVTGHDIAYETHFSDMLAGAGWPVPPVIEPPKRWGGRWWAVFGLLPGGDQHGPDQDRRRGRLLAELHATTASFPTAQRIGWTPVREVVFDPALGDALRFVERHFPRQGHVLLWHLDLVRQRFTEVSGDAPTTVIHGDFHGHNVLFVGDRLTGILDFEAAHHDLRIADFALSWRGRRDEVVRGYDEAAPLSEIEWRLLTPCLWAWVFLGLAREVE
jgi:Ser/Thr protein kinase RdoA (MazF antagonist)